MTAVHQLVERARRRLQVSESLAVAAMALPVAGWTMLTWILVSRMFFQGRVAAPMSSLTMVITPVERETVAPVTVPSVTQTYSSNSWRDSP